jgi:hypothetical protein
LGLLGLLDLLSLLGLLDLLGLLGLLGLLDLLGLFDLLGFFASVRILMVWVGGQAQGRAQRYLVVERGRGVN